MICHHTKYSDCHKKNDGQYDCLNCTFLHDIVSLLYVNEISFSLLKPPSL